MVLEKYKKVFIDEILFLVFPRSRDGTAMQHENIPAKNIKQKNTRAKLKSPWKICGNKFIWKHNKQEKK